MSKTILIMLDGCTFDGATQNLGYLEHLIEHKQGAKYKIKGELPSLSRPLYETILTGVPVYKHGITSNLEVRKSICTSIFDLCVKNGLSTAAAAYYWISELYVNSPFNPNTDYIQLNSSSSIQNGMYYFEDFYPDSHLFANAEFLRNNYSPDFMFVHSMNVDEAGHKHTSNSMEYNQAIAVVNTVISKLLPVWFEQYNVVITSDHGMNEFGLHGGNNDIQRTVPLYVFSKDIKKGDFCNETISQLSISPLICELLSIKPSPEMKDLASLGVDMFDEK